MENNEKLKLKIDKQVKANAKYRENLKKDKKW